MITKFVLVVWFATGQTKAISTETFNTEAECESVALVLKAEMSRRGRFNCYPYTFNQFE